jgi:hypothetical protein
MKASSPTDRNARRPERRTGNVRGQPPRSRRRARTVGVLGSAAVCTALAVGLATPDNSGAMANSSSTVADRAVLPGQPRHFDRLSAALKEVIDARV